MTTEKAWKAATAVFDLKASAIEKRWGKSRLEGLASPELRSKYETARAQLEDACLAGDVELAARKAAVLARGLDALEAFAVAQGEKAEEVQSWVISVNSRSYRIVQHTYEVCAAAVRYPRETVIAVEELLRLQIAHEEGRLLVAAKTTFPMATLTYAGPPKSKLGEMIDDELQF